MKLSEAKTLSDIRKAYVLKEFTGPKDYNEAKAILKDMGYDGDFTLKYGEDGWLIYDTPNKRNSKTSD